MSDRHDLIFRPPSLVIPRAPRVTRRLHNVAFKIDQVLAESLLQKGKWPVFRLDSVSDPTRAESEIGAWRCGRILMRAGKLVEIQRRLVCGNVSVAEVWWQAKFGRRDDDCCWMDYHQPFRMPGFLTFDYIRTGTLARYRTFIGACHVLDEIARIRSSSAIVAHVTNRNISDRLLA